jgi:hypothetical protein
MIMPWEVTSQEALAQMFGMQARRRGASSHEFVTDAQRT